MNADMLRGHAFLPDEDVLAAIPRLYATEEVPLEEKMLWLHYFVGGCDWWVAELDEERRVAFGYACLGDAQNAEWGYVDLGELQAVVAHDAAGRAHIVERDLGWLPTDADDVLRHFASFRIRQKRLGFKDTRR